MRRDKATLSGAQDYRQLGEYWDSHDLADVWDRTKPADFEVDLESGVTLVAVDPALTTRVREEAARRGISSETLINLWIQERLAQEANAS